MKFLFKYATLGRPDWFRKTLERYYSFLVGKVDFEFVITMDEDDPSMNNEQVMAYLDSKDKLSYFYGPHKNKIEAINADIAGIDFDILFVVSDDMIPQDVDFALIIEKDMKNHFPNLDGALHYHDGFAGKNNTITLTIMGRLLYEYFGYIYHPAYKSLFCDGEFTDVVRKLEKYWYSPKIIIKHDWRGSSHRDNTYIKSGAFAKEDETTYIKRKSLGFPK